MDTETLRTTVETVVGTLCCGVIQYADDFQMIREFEGTSLTSWNLRCNGADRGRIIGKGGERFRSLRVISAFIGQRHGHQVKLLELLPPLIPAVPHPFPRFKPNPDWPKDQIVYMASILFRAMFGERADVQPVDTSTGAVLRVLVGHQLPPGDQFAIQEAMDNLFAAIGTTHGADLSVDIDTR